VLYRRASGLIAAFLLIPQLLGAREVACPRHGENRDAAAATASPTGGHEHHHQSTGKEPPPGRHHAPSDCCPAMNSCSGAAIQVDEIAFGTSSLHNDAPADVAALVRSRVESPDPPPPKA
jgi:hypothetical protein